MKDREPAVAFAGCATRTLSIGDPVMSGFLLPTLALVTMGITIALAYWSKARAESALHSRGGTSALARVTRVTDPYNRHH